MHINCIGKKLNFYSVLTVIYALLSKAFNATCTPVPARTKTRNLFVLHFLTHEIVTYKIRCNSCSVQKHCIHCFGFFMVTAWTRPNDFSYFSYVHSSQTNTKGVTPGISPVLIYPLKKFGAFVASQWALRSFVERPP